ncbi:MAG: hypothetical protein IKK25_02880, partial [Lentisphaeria bacterium]|nr:hypothetical protein [Lentisphaeria bacterium]
MTIAMESMTERTGRLVEVDRYGSVRISHGKRSFQFVFIVFTDSFLYYSICAEKSSGIYDLFCAGAGGRGRFHARERAHGEGIPR